MYGGERGNGQDHNSGNGGPATKAGLRCAAGLALDHAGNVVIGDCNRIRVVAAVSGTFYGQQMKAGDIYTIAGRRRQGVLR